MKCIECNSEISADRIQAIELLKLKELCIMCATKLPKIQGLYPSFSGEQLILTDRLGTEEGIQNHDDSNPIIYDYENDLPGEDYP